MVDLTHIMLLQQLRLMEHYGYGDVSIRGQLGQNEAGSHPAYNNSRSSPTQIPGTTWKSSIWWWKQVLVGTGTSKLMVHYGHGEIINYGPLGQNDRTASFITSSNTWYYMGQD